MQQAAQDGLRQAIHDAQETLNQANLDETSQLRVVDALERVVSAYEDSGVEPEDYAWVRENLEERRKRLVEIAETSLEGAGDGDESRVQGTLAGVHRILDRLAPERAEQVKSRAEALGQKPFFARFLESQEPEDGPFVTLKFPSDNEDGPAEERCLEAVTKKFPSDREDVPDTGAGYEAGEPPFVTLKFPSDNDEIMTLKFPSDSDEPGYGS